MLYTIRTWKYFQRTGTGWLHPTTKNFYQSDSDTILAKESLGDLCRIKIVGPQKTCTTMSSEDRQARSGRAVAPSEYLTLERQAPLCWINLMNDLLECSLCTENWGSVTERESIPEPHRYCSHQKQNSSGTTYCSISYRKFSSIIILRDHQCACGSLLNKMLFCGLWL